MEYLKTYKIPPIIPFSTCCMHGTCVSNLKKTRLKFGMNANLLRKFQRVYKCSHQRLDFCLHNMLLVLINKIHYQWLLDIASLRLILSVFCIQNVPCLFWGTYKNQMDTGHCQFIKLRKYLLIYSILQKH